MRSWMERKRRLATFEAAIDRGVADAEAGRVRESDEVRQSLQKRLGPIEEKPAS